MITGSSPLMFLPALFTMSSCKCCISNQSDASGVLPAGDNARWRHMTRRSASSVGEIQLFFFLFGLTCAAGKRVQVLSGHKDWISCCSVSPDCSMIASVGRFDRVSPRLKVPPPRRTTPVHRSHSQRAPRGPAVLTTPALSVRWCVSGACAPTHSSGT